MYNLSKEQFKSAFIVISILFLPMFLGLITIIIYNFEILILIIFLILLILYIVLIIFYKKISNNNNHYLMLYSKKMEIHYHNNKMNYVKTIKYDNIIELEYYKLSSVLSWLQLINGVFPKCVYVKHNSCGKVECEPIGYMNISDIKKISKDINIKLVIK
jgi:hypothetical protein